VTPDGVKTWEEVREWRRSVRAELLAKRAAVSAADRLRVRTLVCDALRSDFPELRAGVIGFYWPFKGELEVNSLVEELVAGGAEAALPVVVEERQPVEFWRWRPRMRLVRGFRNIPVPPERELLQPTALIVPLLGFDAAGYRLGYGGGYYDRTLARMTPRPLAVGVGFELGRLDTIHPQAHDIPLDAIVTENGSHRRSNPSTSR
jgi:5-formyltetrahydrofolate cyclo-ligase